MGQRSQRMSSNYYSDEPSQPFDEEREDLNELIPAIDIQGNIRRYAQRGPDEYSDDSAISSNNQVKLVCFR